MIAHTTHHIEIHHRHDTLLILREVDALGIVFLHPFQEVLGTNESLLLCTEEGEDDTAG